MNYLSICASVRNEARYIVEWLEFHRKVGVEQFYLYDNNSTDNLKEIIFTQNLEYKDIKFINWPINPGQKLAYNDYIRSYKSKSFWTAFIDIDEFLYSSKGKLSDILKDYEECAALAIHWYIYGSNGLKEYDSRPVRERFKMRATKVDNHVKSIVRNDYVRQLGNNVHSFRVRGEVWDENKIAQPLEYGWVNGGSADILRINHYHNKSYAEAIERWSRPRADTGQMRDFETTFPAHDCNEVFDDSALHI